MATVIDYALAEGWRTPADFLRHFGPRLLMHNLAADEQLRVRVLTATTRVNERLAARKTTASAAEDLAIALEQGLTDPARVLALIPPDDRVRYFDAAQLWGFLTEVEFWKAEGADPETRDRHVQRLTFLLETAIQEGVLRLQDIADGIGFKRIASSLPRTELQRLVEHALSRAREGQRLTEEQLLEAIPLRSLMNHVPLEHTWSEVVVARLARPLQFVRNNGEESLRPRRLPPPPPSRNRSGPSSKPGRFDPNLLPESLLELQRGLEQSAPAALRTDQLEELVPVSAEDSEETVAVEVSTRVDIKAHRDEEERHYAEAQSELERVTSALRRLNRLPPAQPELTVPILLSIESMYEELSHTDDDGARFAIVRDAFPNETHLRIALTALIGLLDPNTPNAESLQAADASGLINMLLFAERRLGSQAQDQHASGDSTAVVRAPLGHFF